MEQSDELAQNPKPHPHTLPSLPFHSLQNGFWSPLGGRPILSWNKMMELHHKSWFLLNPRNHNTKKIQTKNPLNPPILWTSKTRVMSEAQLIKKGIWLWYYIDLHVQTIFFFFFFFFFLLLCFSPLLLQLCSRQFDSKLFGGKGEANDTSQEKRKLEAYMSDLRPPLCQKNTIL